MDKGYIVMKKGLKTVSVLLVVLNLFTLVSCGKVDENEIISTSREIAKALSNCDMGAVEGYCSGHTKKLEKAMPVITKGEEPSQDLLIDNMIASTIKYSVDADSFKSESLGRRCSVDVVFTYTDFEKTQERKEKFLDVYDFEDELQSTSNTVELTIPFEFERKNDEYLLTNADDLVELYDYEADIKFIDDFFDFVEDIYMVGPEWDEDTEGYYDTNTFEMVLKISEEGQKYNWDYRYKVALERPEWTNLYMSTTVSEENPDEIHIKYSQEENFTEGFYCILVYSDYSDSIIGYEFDVYRSESAVEK